MTVRAFQVAGQFEVRFVAKTSGCERVHTHEYPVLSTVLSGQLFLKSGGQIRALSSEHIECVLPHQPHAVTAFSPDFGGVYTLALLGFKEYWPSDQAVGESALSLMDLCERLLRSGGELEKCESVRLWLSGLLDEQRELESGEATSDRERVAAQIKVVLDGCAEERVPFEQLARSSGCSKEHCNRCFRAHYGVSIQTYFLNRKAERARELLTTDLNLGQIALEAGFYDQSHMSRIFKGVFQVAPNVYRRHLKR